MNELFEISNDVLKNHPSLSKLDAKGNPVTLGDIIQSLTYDNWSFYKESKEAKSKVKSAIEKLAGAEVLVSFRGNDKWTPVVLTGEMKSMSGASNTRQVKCLLAEKVGGRSSIDICDVLPYEAFAI